MTRVDAALAQIDAWPVSAAGVAVVGPEGIIAARGALDTRFELASVTKPLSSLAILVAVEEEALYLADPADAELLPGATVRHLLAHASGVAPERRLRSFAPGTRRVYSNVGIELAAAHIEAATGADFASYFDEALVGPLGLTSTCLPGSAARAGVSSVRDISRVMQTVLNPDGFLHPTTLSDASTVQYPGLRGVLPGFGAQAPNDWGLGFEIRGAKHPHWTGTANSPATFGHFGQSGTMFWIDPSRGIGVVALTDQAFDDWARRAWPALSDDVLAATDA